MRVFDLLGHHSHPHHLASGGHDAMDVVIDKINAVKNGDAKGVVVYGYMTGCPHCIHYDGIWSEACKNCPKGVFTYKVMMEDFHEDDHRVGTPPRSFPTVYSYTRSPDGTIMRKDHSQSRDDISRIMEDIALKGNLAIAGDEGEEEIIRDDDSKFQTLPDMSHLSTVKSTPKQKRSTKKSKRPAQTRRKGKTKRGHKKLRSKTIRRKKQTTASKKSKKASSK